MQASARPQRQQGMTELLDQWLGYRDRMPFAQAPITAPPGWQLERWQEQNLRTLHTVSVLDERRHLTDPDDILEKEIERLHRKLDVVLELLGSLLQRQQTVLPLTPVRLSREGIAWPWSESDQPSPQQGALLLVQVGLHAGAPQPFVWPVQVIGVQHDPAAGAEIYGRFWPMPEAQAAALERLIFTRHRRSVAVTRLPDSGREDAHKLKQ